MRLATSAPLPSPLSALLAAGVVLALGQPLAGETTFTRDVAPIFLERCGDCHREGGIAPMALTSYRSARPWAKAIRREVESRRMPPYDARGGDFPVKNDISLSEDEIETIVVWVSSGAPEGDPEAMPAVPDYDARADRRPAPDLYLDYGASFTVPADSDMQRAFVVRNDLGRDLWIAGADYEPDRSPVVHHMLAFTDPSGLGRRFDAADPAPGFLGSVDGGEGTDKMMQIFTAGGGGFGGWAPGAGVVVYPPGVGQLLPAGSDVILQYHYWNAGEEAVEHRPRIGLYLCEEAPEKILEFGGPSANDQLVIPPADPRVEHHADWTAQENLEIVAVMPHMHALGKAMRLELTYPGGERRTLIDVPDYRFDWQIVYQYEEPVPLPAGARVDMVAVHDNSAQNPYHPSPEPRLVTFGERSDDEMADGTLFLARRRSAARGDVTRIFNLTGVTENRPGAPMQAVVRFGANGPPGVGLDEDHELGRGHFYYRSQRDPRVSAGVFLEEPLATGLEAWPFSELVYLLDGELTLTDAGGRRETFVAGDIVLVPRGVPIEWRHDEPIRKYFVVFDAGDPSVPATASRTFVRLDPDVGLIEAGPGLRRHDYYAGEGGAVVAVRETDAQASGELAALTHPELMILMSGEAAMIDEGGRVGRVGAGDVVLRPPGVRAGWRQEETVRMLRMAFDVDPAAATRDEPRQRR